LLYESFPDPEPEERYDMKSKCPALDRWNAFAFAFVLFYHFSFAIMIYFVVFFKNAIRDIEVRS